MFGARPRRPGSLVVASFNTHGTRGTDGVPYDPVAACRALDADVLALQEVTGPLTGDLADPWHHHGSGPFSHAVVLSNAFDHRLGVWAPSGSPPSGRWGMVVVSSVPVVHAEVVVLGRARGDPLRAAQVLDLDLDGRRLRLINTHVTHRWLFASAQLQRLSRLVRSGPAASTVVVGDLNAAFGPLAPRLTGLRRAVRAATWPDGRPWLQLDHVLMGSALLCEEAGVVSAGSDHRAVRASLRWCVPSGID